MSRIISFEDAILSIRAHIFGGLLFFSGLVLMIHRQCYIIVMNEWLCHLENHRQRYLQEVILIRIYKM